MNTQKLNSEHMQTLAKTKSLLDQYFRFISFSGFFGLISINLPLQALQLSITGWRAKGCVGLLEIYLNFCLVTVMK